MKTKVTAYRFSEGDGIFTIGCKTLEDAKTAIKAVMDEEENGEDFDETRIEKDLAFEHKICDYITIGDNVCCECGEPTTGNGRKTFVYKY